MNIVFLAFISRPVSLLAYNRASVFVLLMFYFVPINEHHQYGPGADIFQSIPVLTDFPWPYRWHSVEES